jgi:hypothetical protein
MAIEVDMREEGVDRQRRCGRRCAWPAVPFVAGALLAALPLTQAAADVQVRGLMCRGGGGMTVDVADRGGGVFIRMTRDIAAPTRAWLAPGECQWFESARTWRAQARYDALYYCCHTHIDRLTLLIDSGHPFRLWVYPDRTFSSVLVIDAVGE